MSAIKLKQAVRILEQIESEGLPEYVRKQVVKFMDMHRREEAVAALPTRCLACAVAAPGSAGFLCRPGEVCVACHQTQGEFPPHSRLTQS